MKTNMVKGMRVFIVILVKEFEHNGPQRYTRLVTAPTRQDALSQVLTDGRQEWDSIWIADEEDGAWFDVRIRAEPRA